jgi:hypothetical protein
MRGRGGMRQGAGRKPMWENGETQTIRVPVALKDDLIHIGRELDQGQGVIMGKTYVKLEQIVSEWEAKCEQNEGQEWQNVRQFIEEIKEVLSQRKMKGKGKCHQQQIRRGNPHFIETEAKIAD